MILLVALGLALFGTTVLLSLWNVVDLYLKDSLDNKGFVTLINMFLVSLFCFSLLAANASKMLSV